MIGQGGGSRSHGLRIPNPALYQLSYTLLGCPYGCTLIFIRLTGTSLRLFNYQKRAILSIFPPQRWRPILRRFGIGGGGRDLTDVLSDMSQGLEPTQLPRRCYLEVRVGIEPTSLRSLGFAIRHVTIPSPDHRIEESKTETGNYPRQVWDVATFPFTTLWQGIEPYVLQFR